MVEVRDLHCGYGKETILKGVSFTAVEGEITTIIGPNGCGKSTLLKAVCGHMPIAKGEVSIDGQSAGHWDARQTAQRIAYLPQGKNIPDISVSRLVLHGRFSYLGYPRRYRRRDYEIAEEAMRRMGVWELRDKMLGTLSGGMRQKVYIAMALCQQAPVILMDEPTTYLDIRQQMVFADTVKELKRGGKTVVLVLHDILSALKISEKIVVMDGGRVMRHGTPQDILDSGVIEAIYGVGIKTVPAEGKDAYYYTKEF